MELEEILEIPPYSLTKEEKHKVLDDYLLRLARHHYDSCEEYRRMLDSTGVNIDDIRSYEQVPFLPVSLFKDLTLRSIPEENVVKTMTSSGTTGQKTSKIYLDAETSASQTRALARIVGSLIGNKRVPMIVIDAPSVVKDRNLFSARGAGILGFSFFGSKRIYALNDDMELDIEGMKSFLSEHSGETVFLFGFTFMVWQHFYKKLKETGYHPDLSKAVLIHGGGWKKLVSESVSSEQFKHSLHEVCNIPTSNIHDYYGMVEQTGTIYVECECGHLHAPVYSDVIVRNPKDFSIAKNGEAGLVEVLSVLPHSYPGHCLLTEDEGVILGEDDCPCGRKGKYFTIRGRIKNAEIRGCSDTYASKFGTLSGLEYVVGDESVVKSMPSVPALPPFDDTVVSFFNDLSRTLMKTGRGWSDVMTFGFWCRKAALLSRKSAYSDLDCRLGRGIVFHSTPSNVPVNCAFSFAAGLLAGNANIVRLPAKDFPQVRIICDAVKELVASEYKFLAPYICMVKFPPSKEIQDYFSRICQSRVVWGGDATIAEMRQSPLSPRANEINFADRYSFLVIDGKAFLEASDKGHIIVDFYNDTYFSDQNACTAPRTVVWLSDNAGDAKELFWQMVYDYAAEHYEISPVQNVGKLSALYKAAAGLELSAVESCVPYITRLRLSKLDESIIDYRYNSGFFYEYDADSLAELLPIAGVKSQTVTYYGLSKEQIREFIKNCRPHGIDRFVPMGKSMDFSLVWDGVDLIQTLTRIVDVL